LAKIFKFKNKILFAFGETAKTLPSAETLMKKVKEPNRYQRQDTLVKYKNSEHNYVVLLPDLTCVRFFLLS